MLCPSVLHLFIHCQCPEYCITLKAVKMDSQLLGLVGIVLFDVSRYILAECSVCESVWKYFGEKNGKNNSHC